MAIPPAKDTTPPIMMSGFGRFVAFIIIPDVSPQQVYPTLGAASRNPDVEGESNWTAWK